MEVKGILNHGNKDQRNGVQGNKGQGNGGHGLKGQGKWKSKNKGKENRVKETEVKVVTNTESKLYQHDLFCLFL